MEIKTVNDYIDLVHKKYPDVPEAEIKRILVYGFKMILQYVRAGNDVCIRDPKFFFFIGNIPNTPLKTFSNYIYKLVKRIRYMFKRTKSIWDGYYYFALTENQFIDYLKQKRKKKKVFNKVFLYKLLEECKVQQYSHPYIFRMKDDMMKSYSRYYETIKTDKAELIIQRDPLQMQDILTSKNKFKYLQ